MAKYAYAPLNVVSLKIQNLQRGIVSRWPY
jgi:hypothetical protein